MNVGVDGASVVNATQTETPADLPLARLRFSRSQTVGVVLYHLLALLAFLPWFFSWTGVTLAVLGIYVFGVLGINIGYHRLLTHKGFVCPKWLEHGFAVLGGWCLQG